MGYGIANRETIEGIATNLGYVAYWISGHGLVREDIIQAHYPFSNYLFTTYLDSEWDISK